MSPTIADNHQIFVIPVCAKKIIEIEYTEVGRLSFAFLKTSDRK